METIRRGVVQIVAVVALVHIGGGSPRAQTAAQEGAPESRLTLNVGLSLGTFMFARPESCAYLKTLICRGDYTEVTIRADALAWRSLWLGLGLAGGLSRPNGPHAALGARALWRRPLTAGTWFYLEGGADVFYTAHYESDEGTQYGPTARSRFVPGIMVGAGVDVPIGDKYVRIDLPVRVCKGERGGLVSPGVILGYWF